ncbi:hypothetical protein [Hymenobacter properus]|uniref:Uncharacterized protein n=1 Tax=Hymenobacter properus TaxID=2791026 RepID=A0A931FM92_9BACT|nr:hypothetical protein [Hymenobacter properus]MBF9141449.1 hypothetical protein [Hymenobacter properus]MBR7720258.1 hypothetical protein [Microvirga sp. SRT04]
MPAPAVLLLRVAAAWPLPGLGMLVLPEKPAPALAVYPLHTALPVEAALPDGGRHPAVATVEELTRSDAPAPERGLLLDLEADRLPVGTEIWLVEASADPYAGLH